MPFAQYAILSATAHAIKAKFILRQEQKARLVCICALQILGDEWEKRTITACATKYI